jgi:hypothetical protein
MKDPFEIFNLNNFKKWVNESKENEFENKFVGFQVESKISTKKLLDVCEVVEGNSKKVIKEFHSSGGTVIAENNNMLLIENKKGKFELHKMYIRVS